MWFSLFFLQGFKRDKLDDEWDEFVRKEFGARGPSIARGVGEGLENGINTQGCVQHAFHIYDGLAGGIGNDMNNNQDAKHDQVMADTVPGDGEAAEREDVVPVEEGGGADDDVLAMDSDETLRRKNLEAYATTPFFVGASLMSLGATLILLNCLQTHGMSNVLVNELFGILSKSDLPSPKLLPTSEYEFTYEDHNLCLGLATD